MKKTRKEKCIDNIHIRSRKEEREESVDFDSLQDLLKKIYPDSETLDVDDIPTYSTPFYEQEEGGNENKLFLPKKLSNEQIEEIKKSWKEIGNPQSLTELYKILIKLGYMDKNEFKTNIQEHGDEEGQEPGE